MRSSLLSKCVPYHARRSSESPGRSLDLSFLELTPTFQRSSGELASYQQKMFRIDDHVGIAIAGLTSDARVLRSVIPISLNKPRPTHPNHLLSQCSNFMRQQAMASKMVFNRPVPVNRLVSVIADSTFHHRFQFTVVFSGN